MTLYLYSIKDKLRDFDGVMTILDDQNAERIFEGFCKKQAAMEYVSPRYFELYKVGELETETGVVKGYAKQEIKLLKEGEQYEQKA